MAEIPKPAKLIVSLVRDGNFGRDFDDNIMGVCDECGRAVYWRPHAPDLPRVCWECWERQRHPSDVQVLTKETVRELVELEFIEKEAAMWRRRKKP